MAADGSDTGAGDSNSGDTIGSLQGAPPRGGSALDFLERTAMDAQMSSEKIRAISGKVQNKADYPQSQLANGLKLVARLIGGGLPTRVFYVSQGGYDTHTNQLPTQQRLLKDLGDSVKAFTDDLRSAGQYVARFGDDLQRIRTACRGKRQWRHRPRSRRADVCDRRQGQGWPPWRKAAYPSLAPGATFSRATSNTPWTSAPVYAAAFWKAGSRRPAPLYWGRNLSR